MAVITSLVEDNATARENLIPALKDLSYCRVIGFAEGERDPNERPNGRDGSWDLAVVDLLLKDGSGLGALKGCDQRQPPPSWSSSWTNFCTDDTRSQRMARGANAVFDRSNELEGFLDFCTCWRRLTRRPLRQYTAGPARADVQRW